MSNTKKYYWLKLKSDFFEEKYIKALRKLPQGDSLTITYLKMQLKSLRTEGILKYEGILPDCVSELALMLDEDENVVRLTVEALIKFGIVERWDDDSLYMCAMQELIGSESSSAERVRKHRMLQSNEKALLCNKDVIICNTEIEKEINTDIDTELEGEKEIDNKAPQAEAVSLNCPYAKIKELYHSICISFPRIKDITGNRKKAIAARWRTHKSLEIFQELFTIAEVSSFLKGENDRNWVADFDWMMKPTNFSKILEHKYDDRSSEQQPLQKQSAGKGTYELDEMAAVERKMRLERMNKNA